MMHTPNGKRIPFPILNFLARATNAEHRTRLGASNVAFHYLYRDASNYKLHGTTIFTNDTLLSIEEIENQIRTFLKDGEFFIARQVLIEERFFAVLHEVDDHVWHEFVIAEATTEPSFDPANREQHFEDRDITAFIAALEKAHRAGWDELNVRRDVSQMLEIQKRKLQKDLESGGDILK
jgi:hypothetical protein